MGVGATTVTSFAVWALGVTLVHVLTDPSGGERRGGVFGPRIDRWRHGRVREPPIGGMRREGRGGVRWRADRPRAAGRRAEGRGRLRDRNGTGRAYPRRARCPAPIDGGRPTGRRHRSPSRNGRPRGGISSGCPTRSSRRGRRARSPIMATPHRFRAWCPPRRRERERRPLSKASSPAAVRRAVRRLSPMAVAIQRMARARVRGLVILKSFVSRGDAAPAAMVVAARCRRKRPPRAAWPTGATPRERSVRPS